MIILNQWILLRFLHLVEIRLAQRTRLDCKTCWIARPDPRLFDLALLSSDKVVPLIFHNGLIDSFLHLFYVILGYPTQYYWAIQPSKMGLAIPICCLFSHQKKIKFILQLEIVSK